MILPMIFLLGCTSTAEQEQSRAELVLRLEEAGRTSVDDLMRLMVPICLRSLRGEGVDESLLAANGYVKKKALIGGTAYYINLVKPAGIGTYRVYTQINPGIGKNCTIEKSLGTFQIKYLEESAEVQLEEAGFTKLTDNGGVYNNRPLFTDGKMQFTISANSTQDSGSAYLTFVKQ